MKKVQLIFCILVCVLTVYGQPYPRTKNTVRVMSYNIRNARGLDEKVDYQRIANIISGVLPDVVALQELDSVTNRSKHVDVLAQLAGITGMYSVYGASIPFDGGKYGIGILSKKKPRSWKRMPLPGREEARSLLMVEFKDYVLCCIHFSLNEDDRKASVPIIDRAVMACNKPVFLAGDINATPESVVLEAFGKNWTILTDIKQFTIPADKPNRTIDYILGNITKGYIYQVLQTKVLEEPVASDHLPLFIDVRLKRADK